MKHVTELEGRLAGPDALALREELSATLGALEQRLRTRIAARLPPDEFNKAAALTEATLAAREVLAHWPITREAR